MIAVNLLRLLVQFQSGGFKVEPIISWYIVNSNGTHQSFRVIFYPLLG